MYLISNFFLGFFFTYCKKHITAIIYLSENKKCNNYLITDKYTQRAR